MSLVGGLAPALIAAVAGSVLLNYFFTPPLHTLTISETNNALALLVFVLVAALVSSTVDLAARRTRQAARAAAESRTLANLAGSVLGGEEALSEMLQRVRETFALTSVTLLERSDDGWTPVGRARDRRSRRPRDADTEVPAGDGLTLALRGRLLQAEDQRLVGAFAAQAAVVARPHPAQPGRRRGGTARGGQQGPHRPAGRRRPRLPHPARRGQGSGLHACSATTSTSTPTTAASCSQAADTSLDRLAALVDNLLDMSRLQAGAMSIDLQPTARRRGGGPRAGRPRARRAAHRHRCGRRRSRWCRPTRACWSGCWRTSLPTRCATRPPTTPPHLTCSRLGDRVEIRVIDRGPGIPPDDWDRVFLPFQRLGDTDNTTGVGLGLALSRGLTEAMGGIARARGDPRRWAHHGRLAARPPTGIAPAAPGRARARTRPRDDPRPGRRRRAPAAPRAEHQPARPPLRGARRRRREPRRSRWPPPTRPTW